MEQINTKSSDEVERLLIHEIIGPNYVRPRSILKERIQQLTTDINMLIGKAMQESNSEQFMAVEYFKSLKKVWKETKFSCIHHAKRQEEITLEYYQAIYQIVLSTLQSMVLSDYQFAAMYLMILYLIIETAPDNQKVQVNISLPTYNQIVRGLEQIQTISDTNEELLGDRELIAKLL